jgi:hypothetical protein
VPTAALVGGVADPAVPWPATDPVGEVVDWSAPAAACGSAVCAKAGALSEATHSAPADAPNRRREKRLVLDVSGAKLRITVIPLCARHY